MLTRTSIVSCSDLQYKIVGLEIDLRMMAILHVGRFVVDESKCKEDSE